MASFFYALSGSKPLCEYTCRKRKYSICNCYAINLTHKTKLKQNEKISNWTNCGSIYTYSS